MTWERASGKAVAETEISPNLKSLLDFRPPVLGPAGHDPQVHDSRRMAKTAMYAA